MCTRADAKGGHTRGKNTGGGIKGETQPTGATKGNTTGEKHKQGEHTNGVHTPKGTHHRGTNKGG